MATKVSREDYWANIQKLVTAYEAKQDEVAVFLAKLTEVRDEPVHEV